MVEFRLALVSLKTSFFLFSLVKWNGFSILENPYQSFIEADINWSVELEKRNQAFSRNYSILQRRETRSAYTENFIPIETQSRCLWLRENMIICSDVCTKQIVENCVCRVTRNAYPFTVDCIIKGRSFICKIRTILRVLWISLPINQFSSRTVPLLRCIDSFSKEVFRKKKKKKK